MKTFFLNPLRRSLLAGGAALLLHACAPNQDAPTPVVGLNVSRYLAVGDSYTAGVSAGGLTRNSQEYSYPNLLARQLQLATPAATFSQPLLEPGTGAGYLDLVDFTANGLPRARRVPGQAVRRTVFLTNACTINPDTLRLLARSATANVLPQNLGVPGLMLSQIEAVGLGNEASVGTGAFNPYFERLLPASDSRTYLQAVTTAAGPATFFTFFMGLDDLMPYVRSGGTCGSLPSSSLLKSNARKILDVLTAGGRPGIISRLPAVTALPLLRQGKGTEVEARLQAFYGDKALLYIEDPFNPGMSQRISDKDYVLATALPRLGQPTPVPVGTATLMLPYGRDARSPIRNADVLDDASELSRISGLISNYNTNTTASTGLGLEALAKAYKLPIIDVSLSLNTLDVNALFANVANTISINGVIYTAEPVRGNFFSLDSYTLSPRGNGLLANAFITAINKAYRSNIPSIDVNNLPTVSR